MKFLILAAGLTLLIACASALQMRTKDSRFPASTMIQGEDLSDPRAAHGRDVIRTKQIGVPLAKIEDLKTFWTVWEDEDEKQSVQNLSGDKLLDAVGKHYGLFKTDYDNDGLPLGLMKTTIVNAQSGKAENWAVINCYFCHSTKINNQMIWGGWNFQMDYQSLIVDNLLLKEKQLGMAKDTLVKKLPVTFSQQNGHFNLIKSLGIAGASMRDASMNLRTPVDVDKLMSLTDADIDAQPWWNSHRKKRLYWDGWMSANGELHSSDLAGKISFLMGANGLPQPLVWRTKDDIDQLLHDIADVYAYHMSTITPKYPYPIDSQLAKKGEEIFQTKTLANGLTCANCHGNYGSQANYQNLFFPVAEVGTDPTRFNNMPKVFLDWYRGVPSLLLTKSDNNGQPTHADVGQQRGYQAPPLNGIWAAAPYLHNGSVPTLRDILHPDERPPVWKIVDNSDDMYDAGKVGLRVERANSMPANLSEWKRRKYYDSTNAKITGASIRGHEFSQSLKNDEADALLEYLKTL